MNNVYDTINYIDYGLMGIIAILLLGIFQLYTSLMDVRNHKEHWRIIALEKERLYKVIEGRNLNDTEAEVGKRIDEMIERIKKKNAE
jgi:hypothetical protein